MASQLQSSDVPAPSVPNLAFVEGLYYAWLADPSSVEEPWRRYFEKLPATPGTAPAPRAFPPRRPDGARAAGAGGAAQADAAFQARVDRLVSAYREFGHLRADLDPLRLTQRAERFSLQSFGLGEADLDRRCADGEGRFGATLRQLVAQLEETYCRTIGVEVAHMHAADLRLRHERAAVSRPLHPLLEPQAQVGVVHVRDLDPDGAAVGLLELRDELPERRAKAALAVGAAPVEVRLPEAEALEREPLGPLREPQGIEVGAEVSELPVGADEPVHPGLERRVRPGRSPGAGRAGAVRAARREGAWSGRGPRRRGQLLEVAAPRL